jgi:glycogen debranching enzyme
MQQLEGQTYDPKYGLFRGPSVFNDGIAAYPEPVYDPTNPSGASMDHPGTRYIKCLSTNCVYYGAYIALNKMAELLNIDNTQTKAYAQKAAYLKQNILKYLYDADNNSFYYLIDQNGGVAKYQEGLGISFAVMFGVIDANKANQLISNAVVSKYGLTTIYPTFPRHSEAKPGRHNNLIWPMVNGFFAQAAIDSKSYPVFTGEFYKLTHLALDEDKGNYDFREIYSPYNGQPEGGWQSNGPTQLQYHWASCKLQTWSATAYISMVLHGLVGARFNANSLSFAPYLPAGITYLKFSNFIYRGRDLNITIRGAGSHIKRFTIDGKVTANDIGEGLPAGPHAVAIELGNSESRN